MLVLSTSTASAGQTHTRLGFFCEPTGIGLLSGCEPTFGNAYSLAIQQGSGDLLVLDAGEAAIRRFKPNGELDPFPALGTNVIDGEGSGSGPGSGGSCVPVSIECDETPENGFTVASFANEAQIAVDSSGTETDGNIYLTQKNAFGLHLVDIFASTGEYLGQLTGTEGELFGANSRPVGVAVDASGDVFVSDFLESKIYRYVPSGQLPVDADGEVFSTDVDDPGRLGIGAGHGPLFVGQRFGNAFSLGPDGTQECEVQGGETSAVAVDPENGHVFISDAALGQGRTSEYAAEPCAETPKAVPISSFDGARTDIAVEGSSGYLFLTAGANVEVYSGLVPLPDPHTDTATSIAETGATLNGVIEAHGEELTECSFEYGLTNAYGGSVPCAESFGEVGTGTSAVHADLIGLAPETAYHYRLKAANANGPASPQGEDREFQTVGAPQIVATWAAGVTLDEATLKAQINPQSANTSYSFEWGLGAEPYEHATPPIAIGSDPVPHTVSLALTGLMQGTSYHYRILASNHCRPQSEPGRLCTSEGEDHALTTYAPFVAENDCPNQSFRSGASAFLPDCRAYEMVSPVDKNGGDITRELSGAKPGDVVQASMDGASVTYTSLSAFGNSPSALDFNQYLATRHERGLPEEGWSNEGIHTPVAGQGVIGETFGVSREFMAFTPNLCSAWLVDSQTPPPTADGQEGYTNLYRRHGCAPAAGSFEALVPSSEIELPLGTDPNYVNRDSVEGYSADGAHAIFTAEAALTPDAAGGNNVQVYDRFDGALHLVSVLPNGEAATDDSAVGSNSFHNLDHAVSVDGSRVYWTAHIATVGKLYLRKNECGEPTTVCTIPVSATDNAFFWTAALDGSGALYTEGEDLFVFDLGSAEAEEPAQTLIAHHVTGVAGASDDLSRIYFVSSEALNGKGEGEEEGGPNLYLAEGGTFSLIGTLAAGDVGVKEPGATILAYNDIEKESELRATRVSANGSRIAFDSRAPLTGYDNTGPDGRAAVEVFVYEAGGGLECVSCNPSGARPSGVRELLRPYSPPTRKGNPTNVPAAAWIPTWEHPLHASNSLSADGNRLFFNSNDALLPRDANGAPDVYEWEAAGSGGCSTGSSGYFAQNGGCIYLISSGESPEESEFWEASPDGENVFFTTSSSLLPQDPGSIDLYDARIGGGFPQPESKVPCEGEACQSPPPPPRLPTPASRSYKGLGNPNHAKKRCPQGQAKVRKAGKTHCVAKKKHHKSSQKHRAGTNRRTGR
jgi:hypothetical protein